MAIRIIPYNMASESATLLANSLGTKLIFNEKVKSKYEPSKQDMIINWGGSSCWIKEDDVAILFNNPDYVKDTTNKLRFFQKFDGKFNHPDWTEEKITAALWSAQGYIVFARETLTGSGGEGIIQIEPHSSIEDIPQVPLYTKYIPKAAEYRVHVIAGSIVDIQQKVRQIGLGDMNFRVRSHANGFIFVRYVNNQEVKNIRPPSVETQALQAARTAGLDFCGADIIYNRQRDKAYVIELNSAPGIEGTTVENYSVAFENYYDLHIRT